MRSDIMCIFDSFNLDPLFNSGTPLYFKDNDGNNVYEFLAPGLKKSDFKVSLVGNRLSIEARAEKENFYTRSFKYALTLSTDNPDDIKCSYESGLLRILVSKRESAVTTIEVK